MSAPGHDLQGVATVPARSARLPLVVLPLGAFVTVTAEALPVGLLRQMAEGLRTSPSQVGLLVAWFAVVAGTTPGTAAGAMMVGASCAFVVGVPAATWFGQVHGWRAAHLLVGAAALVLAAALPVTVPRMPPAPDGTGSHDVGIAALLRCRPLLAVLAVTGLAVLSHFSLFTFLAPFLEDEVGLPARALGLVLAAFGTAGVVGSLVGGRLAEARPRAVTVTAIVVLLASYLVLRLLAASPLVVVLAVSAWGATFSVVAVSQQVSVLRLTGHGPSGETAAALNGAVFQGGIATGSAVGSALVGAGLLAALPLASAVVAVLALAVVLTTGTAGAVRPVPSSPTPRAAGAHPSEQESSW